MHQTHNSTWFVFYTHKWIYGFSHIASVILTNSSFFLCLLLDGLGLSHYNWSNYITKSSANLYITLFVKYKFAEEKQSEGKIKIQFQTLSE